MKRIGVDVGGTFTDLILVDEELGRITVDKVPSTPDDPARGTVEGVRGVCERGAVAPQALDAILHGTTVATNIVLQKRPYNFSLHGELPWQPRPRGRRRHRLRGRERAPPPAGEIIEPLDDE